MYKRMDRKKYIKYGFVAILFAGLISGLTYYLAPEKVKIKEVEKIVEVEGEKEIIYRERIKVVIKRPDGTVEEREEERDLSQTEKEKRSDTEKTREKEVKRSKKSNLLGAYMLTDPLRPTNSTLVFSYQRRLLGEIYVGGIATSDGAIGAGITIRF